MNDHWSEYWSQGCLTSFGTDFSDNYTGVLKDIWMPFANELVTGFSILDIGTGNGALPYLLANELVGADICGEIIGVDLADINTLKIEEHKSVKIRLEGKVNIEEFISDDKFDFVISQFGIEYSNLKLSLPRVTKVLNPNASFHIVCHHDKSMIIKRNRRVLALIKSPLVYELWEVMKSQVEAMGNLSNRADLERVKHDIVCESLREKINEIISTLVEIDEASMKDSELLTYITKFFKDGLFWSVEAKLKYIYTASNEIVMLKKRLAELVDASIDEKKLCWIINLLFDLQLTLITAEVVFDNQRNILAWKLHFKNCNND
jgi:ubiquinone/menaquinone biosynthesis C-methylase UbiE